MLLNLIQSHFARLYNNEIFCFSLFNKSDTVNSATNTSESNQNNKNSCRITRRPGGSSLGIFCGFNGVGNVIESKPPLTRDAIQKQWRNRPNQNKTTQTHLSFPNKITNAKIAKTIGKSAVIFLKESVFKKKFSRVFKKIQNVAFLKKSSVF